MPTAWEDPPGSEPRIDANAQELIWDIERNADLREPPSVARAQQWHRKLYDGIPRPFAYYAGEVRDSDPRFPDLIGYEVEVGGSNGTPAALVPAALVQFELGAQSVCSDLDADIAVGTEPGQITPTQLHGVLTLCAFLHGEWVRIHPFANGNGRTARVWANWAALRYGLPPFVTIKPRPGHPYGAAALASMQKDHRVMVAVFNRMLRDYASRLA